MLNSVQFDAGVPVQFALAGMNTHISHDLPIAIAATCAALSFAPTATVFRDDYETLFPDLVTLRRDLGG